MRTRRFIILSVIASILLGGAGAMVLGMAAPRWLPKKSIHYHLRGLNNKYVSWGMDYYQICPPAPLPSGRDAARLARSMQFTPDADHLNSMHEALLTDFPTFPTFPGGWCNVIDAGFPFRCVTGWRYDGPSFVPDSYRKRHYPRIEAPTPECPIGGFFELSPRMQYDGPDTRWIPYFPLWPGLIGNALVWGSVIWVVLFGVRLARQRLRIRRGLCVRCAYDRRGISTAAPCPECGTAPVDV